jgi:hypothetical protein
MKRITIVEIFKTVKWNIENLVLVPSLTVTKFNEFLIGSYKTDFTYF